MQDPYRLDRFTQAQDQRGTYQRAVAELHAGRKTSHWMWFVFPQIEGLGLSAMSREFAVSSLAEARAYLRHPILGSRLIECAAIVADTEGKSAADIFGAVDAMKLRSSMTLFMAAASGEEVFARVLDKYFDGASDEATLMRLRDAPNPRLPAPACAAHHPRRPRVRAPASEWSCSPCKTSADLPISHSPTWPRARAPGRGPTGDYQMEPAAPKSASPVSRLERESVELRARRLAAARRRATALLGAVTILFVAVTAVGAHGSLLGYVQAGAEAAMVGGVADWFAVTALFRHPLGLPIPHTAVIVERKDRFAATLGQFVQENFLNADVLAERIRSARLVPRLEAWMADQANAGRFAGHAADLVVTLVEALRDEDVQRMFTAELTRAAEAVDVAPLAGRALRAIIAEGHHAELFNTIMSATDRYLADHYDDLRDRFETEAPRWVPDMVYRRVFDSLYTRLRHRLAEMADDPNDETRRQFEEWLTGLPERLETSPELRERGERIKRDVLGSAVLRDWSSSLWKNVKETLRAQAADPDSELRRRLADALAAGGRRLGSDSRLQDSLERVVESGARALADQFHDELAGLVTGTIQRWDAGETSFQLELLLGRDLQFIRINGTVVGAGVGLALHAIALALA